MRRMRRLATISVIAAAILALIIAGTALAQGSPSQGSGGGGRGCGRQQGGMMGGGSYGRQQGSTTGGQGNGRQQGGMMGNQGYGWQEGGMMGGYGYGYPMGGSWSGYRANGTPISSDQAVAAARAYISAYGNPDLQLGEVMAFSNNFYAQAIEKSTGRAAFEFLVDRYTGAAYPEPGPNMMWNTKYGYMTGMMGGSWGSAPAGGMTVTPEAAHKLAQQYLDSYAPGTTVESGGDAFYGYYTIETLRNGKIAGMLSVNGYTGQVWLHTWHGSYIGTVGQ